MKTKQLRRYVFMIAITAFLGVMVGNAFAANNASRDPIDGEGSYANDWIVASPYWQVSGGESYTFIAVTHSSLSGMASTIGVTINAIDSAGSAYNTAESFTITAGNTQRVFIVPTNHATINTTNITSSATFISGTTDFTYGHIRVNPVTSHPMLKIGGDILDNFAIDYGQGFRDITMLSYWGSIIVEAQTTGFAMEFIGDMNDSQTTVNFKTGYASGVNLQ